MLVRRCAHSGGGGLPADDGCWKLPLNKRFRVHVLVPCYKEPLSTVQATVGAAISAELPPGCSRVVYLCDDGRDPAKEAYIMALRGRGARYVSGRTREPGEINGKAANLNSCLKHVVAPGILPGGPVGLTAAELAAAIPPQELVVVFDADMVAKPNFFRHVLEVMWDEDVSLCLTPQAFSNVRPAADIWNNINAQFFQYVLPGCDALGYTACTGTNFCVRTRALAQVGWFPTYTITEDYALSMELQKEGEAPEEVGAVLQQRSRWAKGHMQVFFSRRCPLFQPVSGLTLLQRVLYTNGTWAYFCTILSSFIYTLIPCVSLVWGVHPVVLSSQFALAATLYFLAGAAVNFNARSVRDLQGCFLSLVANNLLTFCYLKAVVSTWLSLLGLKRKAGFKATEKKGITAVAGQAIRAAVAAVSQLSVTVTNRLASTYRSVAGHLPASVSGGRGGPGAGAGAPPSAPAAAAATGAARPPAGELSVAGGSSSASHGVSASGTGSSHGGSREVSFTGRWQAWRTFLTSGSQPGAAQASSLGAGALLAARSAAPASSGSMAASALGASGLVDSGGSCSTTNSQGSTAAGDSVLYLDSSVGGVPAAAQQQPAVSGAGGAARRSRLRIAASGAITTPGSEGGGGAGQVGSPLGEGTEDGRAPPRTGKLPTGGERLPGSSQEAVPAAAAACGPAAAGTLGSSLAEAPGAARGCCWSRCSSSSGSDGGSCAWLRANVRSIGWRLDPFMILFGLIASLVAIAAGAVQLVARSRSASQQQQVLQILLSGRMDEFAVLAMILAGINAIPPLLFLAYCCTKGRLLRGAVWLGQAVNAALFVGAVAALWLLIPPSHDLAEALKLSAEFLQAQRVTPAAAPAFEGEPPFAPASAAAVHSYPWLVAGASTGSVADVVQGGLYMGGDYVKHSFPLATNLAMLAWSLVHFSDTFAQAGVLEGLRGTLSLGAQQLMDCHVAPGSFVAQIGNPADYAVTVSTAAGFWGLPANMPGNRTALVLNAQRGAGGAEVLAAASAALAATSAAMRSSPAYYSSDLRVRLFETAVLSEAISLYREAQAMAPEAGKPLEQLDGLRDLRGAGQQAPGGLVGVQAFGSSSVMDDMAFAAGWLAVATANASLLAEGHAYLAQHWAAEAAWDQARYWWPSHDNMAWPAAVLLITQQQHWAARPPAGAAAGGPEVAAAAAMMDAHHSALSSMFRGWLTGRNARAAVVSRTKTGFPWTASGQPMPTAAAAGLLGMLWTAGDNAAAAARLTGAANGGRRLSEAAHKSLGCWALQMANHALGPGWAGPDDFSFLVGYGASYPKRPQHRLASCSASGGVAVPCSVTTGLLSQRANAVQLTGALVAGPSEDGSYADDRTLTSQSAVGLHHNVPFVGLLGALLASGLNQGQCAAGNGLYQLYTVSSFI